MARPRKPRSKADHLPEPNLGLELGITNLSPTSSWARWYGNGQDTSGHVMIGRDPLSPNLNELMYMLRRDGQAQAMFNLLTLPIRAAFTKAKWTAPDGSEDGPEVEFANQMWNLPSVAGGMSVPRTTFLRQSLLALPHGFSTFEVVKAYREEGPLAGKFVIDKMGYRDPLTVTMLTDTHGEFQGFRQQTNFAGRFIDVTVDKQNAWYFAANEEFNPMYGVSYFEPAFQHYQIKRKLYYICDLAAMLAAVPGRVGKIPLGASNRQIVEFKKALEQMHFAQAMLLPPNFELDKFDNTGHFDFEGLLTHHNQMMATSILATFLNKPDGPTIIDNGGADAAADMFIELLEAIASELSESWSLKLMPQFIDYNFGTGIYPVHQFAPMTDSNKEAIFTLFQTLVGLQFMNCTPEFVRAAEIELSERFGFSIDYDKVANEEQTVADQMQKQAAQEAAAQQALQQAQATALKAQPKGPTTAKPASGAPTPQGGRPPTTPKQPTIKASALTDKKAEALSALALALNDLIEVEDVPDYFAPEGEIDLSEVEEFGTNADE